MTDVTRASLLIRIRDREDALAWAEFEQLYAPLIYRFARARGLSDADALDVRSTCYLTLVQQIADFQYDKAKGGFKAWLRTLVNRRVIDLLRKRRERAADTRVIRETPSAEGDAEAAWEQAWQQQHLRFCIESIRAQVPESTYEAFRLLVDEQLPVPEVCERLALNRNQVYKAKSQMLERVRLKMQAIYAEEL